MLKNYPSVENSKMSWDKGLRQVSEIAPSVKSEQGRVYYAKMEIGSIRKMCQRSIPRFVLEEISDNK